MTISVGESVGTIVPLEEESEESTTKNGISILAGSVLADNALGGDVSILSGEIEGVDSTTGSVIISSGTLCSSFLII